MAAKWTWAPNNQWAFVPSVGAAITYDLERGLLCLITAEAVGQAFGTISTDTLVPTSWPGGTRRFGSVPSGETVNPGSGARRWGAVPSDEQVPDPWT